MMPRLRHAASLVRGTGFPPEHQGSSDGELPFFKVGDFGLTGNETYLAHCDNWVSEATALKLRARPVPEGTVVLPKIGAALLLGARRITTQRSVFDNNVLGIVPSQVDGRYLRYWLMTVDLAPLANPGPVPSLDDDALRDLALPLSARSQQRAIADYLDAETARIDSLVEARRHQLRVLPERLAAFVAELVAGIQREPLGHCLVSVEQGWSPTADEAVRDSDDQWAVLKLSAVTGGTFRPTEHKTLQVCPGAYARYEVRAGDLLMTRANTPELVGDVVFVDSAPRRLLIPDLVYRLEYDLRKASGRYLGYVLRTEEVRGQLAATARGTSQSMVKIRGADIRQITISLPDVQTQTRIAQTLDGANRWTRGLTDSLVRQIDLLQERRQALITAAVTGQIEIPGVAA